MNIGSIIQWSSNTIPDGWLLCDGSAVSRTTYAELFSVIGTTYGSGDGSTTFNLPNYKGRVGVGLDSNDTDFNTLGETRGEKTHTLTIDEMPSHKHQINKASTAGGDGSGLAWSGTATTDGNAIQFEGGGQAHNIIQPSIVTNYIIKALNPDSIKISELESASSVTSSDVFVLVQNGETKKVTVGNLLKETYSTNEIDTGKVWIDGKPIYRKTLTGTLPVGAGEQTFTISNSIIHNFYGKIVSKSGPTFMINTYYTLYPEYSISGWINRQNNQDGLVINCGANYDTSSQYEITIEYTKTTD